MQIPSSIKVGRKKYKVEHRKRMPLMVTGRLYVHSGVLQIGAASTN